MRLLFLVLLFFIIGGCSSVEVTKEIIKAGKSVKATVSDMVPKNKSEEKNNETESKTAKIIEEEEKIKEEQEKQKSIVETQQKLASINFIGKTLNELKSELGEPQLTRSDGSTLALRYDSDNCRLFLFFNLELAIKRVEHFEVRDSFGKLINSKQSLEGCYREYNLIN